MNRRLEQSPFFAGTALSVADIALYAYTHTAEQGGFQIDAYPAVATWLKRVEADPGHVPIEWLPAT
jgi:glutathione S-transferase